MSLERYVVLVLVVTGGSLAVLRALFGERLAADQWTAALLGGTLATANTVAAYGLVRWSSGRSTQAFLGAILGGMLGRMALMLATVAAAVAKFDLPGSALAISLLSYFVLFLGLELAVLPRPGASRQA
jgi:hypothetical protein